jgi:crotonobetainyl-CoA:carnitine CoA-transferase CaiB-like acyl-CoA transferase
MGRPELAEDARFKDHSMRLKEENATAILKIIADWVRARKAEEIEALAEKHGFAATHLYTAKDLVENERFRIRDFWTEINDPLIGKYNNYEFPVKMSETPPNTSWSVRPVGFDNEYIMKKFLARMMEIKKLYEAGAWASGRICRDAVRPRLDGKQDCVQSKENFLTTYLGI